MTNYRAITIVKGVTFQDLPIAMVRDELVMTYVELLALKPLTIKGRLFARVVLVTSEGRFYLVGVDSPELVDAYDYEILCRKSSGGWMEI